LRRPGNIIALILRQGLGLTAVGAAIGIVASIALGRVIENRLFGVAVVDPVTFGATVGTLVVVAGVACWLPARRATQADPVVALRCDTPAGVAP
jgi:ABC-type antimicrobial peptide transport system permease subunit